MDKEPGGTEDPPRDGNGNAVAAHPQVVELVYGLDSLRIEAVDPESAEARWCVEQYFTELATLFEDGFDPAQAHPVDPRDLRPPRGVCLVAESNGVLVGTGSLKPLEPTIGYIKRMWVSPEARGLGLGKRILSELEDWARRLEYTHVRLETKRELERAIAMYRNRGYVEIERFNEELYGDFWFEKALD